MTMPDDMRAFNRALVEEFRANDGEITTGMLKGSHLALLTTTGAKSGQRHTTPLGYFLDGPDRVVLWASNNAAAAHPAWYHNLSAHPEVSLEIMTDSGVDRFKATATTAQGAERDRLIGVLRESKPHMAGHQDKVEREIPVVVCERSG